MVAVDFTRYSQVFATRGAPWFTVAGWLGRFPRSALSLSIIMLIAAKSGSYTLAGLVSAAFVTAMGVAGPLWSRAMDRRGQNVVLRLASLSTLTATVTLAILVVLHAPLWTWFVAAALLGLTMADLGAAVRVRWSALATGDTRSTAFAVESIADELVFVVAPPLVAVIAAVADPVWGIVTVVAIGLCGAVALLAHTASEPDVIERTGGHRHALLPPVSILPVAVASIGIGGMFGAFDVTAVAWGRESAEPWLTGLLMAAMALGNTIGSLVFGALYWQIGLRARYLGVVSVLAVLVWLLPLTAGSRWLIGASLLVGMVVGPAMVSAYALVSSRADPQRATELMSYLSLGTAAGVPFGGTVAGVALDHSGPGLSLLVLGGFAASIVLVASIGEAWLAWRGAQAGCPPEAASLPSDSRTLTRDSAVSGLSERPSSATNSPPT